MKKALFILIAAIACCMVFTSCESNFDKTMNYLTDLEERINTCQSEEEIQNISEEIIKMNTDTRFVNIPDGYYKNQDEINKVGLKAANVIVLSLKKRQEFGLSKDLDVDGLENAIQNLQ